MLGLLLWRQARKSSLTSSVLVSTAARRKRAPLWRIAAIIGLLLLATPLVASGAQSVHNGLIVFQRNLPNSKHKPRLFSIRSDGSGLTRLLVTEGDVSEPSFSPDGQHLVFVRGLGLGRLNGLLVSREAVYISDANGGGAKKLYLPPLGKHVGSPVYSPDGRHIAFVELTSQPGHVQELAVRIMSSNGSRVHTVHGSGQTREFTDPYHGRELAFSPDGRTIVFGQITRGKKSALFAMNVNGSHVRQLTPTAGNNGSLGPDLSPDGTKIVFTRETRICTVLPRSGRTGCTPAPEVFIMNADGSQVQRLTGPGPAGGYRSPVFSPDGSQLAFVGAFVGSNNGDELFVANADGSAQQQLTHSVCAANCAQTADNDNPTWQPVPGP